MIDTSVIRERFMAVGPDLNERSRRLLVAAEAKNGRPRRDHRGLPGNRARPQHDRPRLERPGRPWLVVRRGSPPWWRAANTDRDRPHSAGRPAPIGGTRDDGRSDASAAVGREKSSETGGCLALDGAQDHGEQHSQTAEVAEVSPAGEP